MNRCFKNKTNKGACKPWGRMLCAICAIVLILLPCSGCMKFVSTDELDTLKNELAEELDHLKGLNNDSQAEIDRLRAQNEAAQQEIDSLKQSNAASQQEIDALQKTNGEMQQEIDGLQESKNAAEQRIDALEESRDAAVQQLDALKKSLDAAEQQIDALEESRDAAVKQLDTLRKSLDAAEQELDALKKSNAATEEELNALQESYAAALQEIELLKQQIEDLQNEPSEEKIRIYIDQGHNPSSYHNSGAVGNGLFEQDLTFTIGCLLAQLLEADGRFEIRLSRPTASTVLGTDNASSLEARVLGAQEFGADYFISLHTNAFESESANGIEVFVATEGSTSYAFGNSLLQGMLLSTNLRDRGMKLNPDLYVLKNATMPAVLLEMGFITNVGDSTLLSESPELFAQGIYNGILSYFNLSAQE